MSPNEVGTLLLVEDNLDDILLFRRACEKECIASGLLRVAEDGEEALSYLEGRDRYADRVQYPLPSLMVLDLKLPGKSGVEVLVWIRNDPRCKDLPVIVLTTSNEPGDLTRTRELGIVAYHLKSVDFEGLIEIVKSINSYWKTHPVYRL
jgi:CheY-like chemotaxis protein